MTCRREKELLEQIEQTGEMYKVSALQLIKAGKRIAELESLNGALCRDSAGFVQERDALAAQVEVMRDALSLYASEYSAYWRPGMTILEPIADTALALPNISADILRQRDARVLREMAERLEDCYATGGAAVDAVMMTRKAANAMEANHG